MDKKFNLFASILIFASLMMGHSISIVTESHSHNQEFEHSSIEENHREVDHDHSDVASELSFNRTSRSTNPVHEHKLLKISSLLVVGRTLFAYSFVFQAVNKSVSFTFPKLNFNSVPLTANLRPPISA